MKKRIFGTVALLLATALIFSGCKPEIEEEENQLQNPTSEYPDWSEATHGKGANPNFDVVFPDDKVLRLDIQITQENWDKMWDDLAANLGSGGGHTGPGGPGGPGIPGGGGTVVDFTPIWVPSTVIFEGKHWYEVGIRFKGNSSLSSAYQSNIDKLSMKLDFDEFEDDFPLLKNQRFYGFKQLNLNNNYNDQSLMREKVACDLYRQFGLAAAHATFCEVYIDNGSGPEYYGLYTLLEEVDNTVIKTQFSSNNGNLYKPDGTGATFANGSYNTADFYPKTNELSTNYSDMKALYDALHSSLRTTDVEAWKTQLEAAFDVNTFMKWLAVNTTIQNWDTYGNMSHNYFLYNNPANQKLTWITWDHNEAFQDGHGDRIAYNPNQLQNVSTSWPIINYLIDIEEYKNLYDAHLRAFINDVFNPSTMGTIYSQYFTLLQQSAYAEETGRTFISYDSQFDNAVNTLQTHVQNRNSVIESYLN